MSENIALSVKNISKNFRLPHEKNSSIKSGIVHAFKKKDKSVTIQHALKGVSFDIKEGEFFGILGRNGSGKSTLLKMLAEIYQPTDGTVHIQGKLVPFIELGVGFNPELTGRENVYLNGALLGFSRKEIDARYDDIVKFAELEEFMDQKLKNYSSGMQVRLAFSVATRAEADILLVDEVLAVGDADFQRKCYDFFSSLKKSGKTVVFVTHDMSAVKEYCDRAILIDNGKITFEGKASKVADEYLKLFNKVDEDSEVIEGDTNRWGNGHVRVLDHELTVDKKMRVEFTLKASKAVKDVVIGFRLYDGTDALLAGASSVNARKGAQRAISFEKGEVKKIIFEGENILGTGDYRLGYTVRLADGITVCDDNDNVARFNYHFQEGYQPIICPVELVIENGNG